MNQNKLSRTKTLVVSTAAFLLASTAQAANTDMTWKTPDEYTDLGTDFHDDVNLEMFRDEVEPYVARIANNVLPDGSQLKIVVTNVDLAGEYEPWRLNNDVRIVRSIYPPRMSFTYKLYDIKGDLISSGNETIVDTDFDFNIGRRFFQSDGFFYEKEMIASWVRYDLANAVES